jgi:hypothetical protein
VSRKVLEAEWHWAPPHHHKRAAFTEVSASRPSGQTLVLKEVSRDGKAKVDIGDEMTEGCSEQIVSIEAWRDRERMSKLRRLFSCRSL